MLPNWIIIGVPKASTSSLFRWLVDHPQAAGSAQKETYYFVDPGTHMFRPDCNFRDHGMAGYERLFAHSDPAASVVVEATPSYIYSDTALRELPRLPTRPKFIVVLREPVAQLRSMHAYFQQNWNWIPGDMKFGDFIAAVDGGPTAFHGNELAENALANTWYTNHLRRWSMAVGAERLVLILFDDLVNDSRSVMRRLADRMGIDPNFYDSYDFPVENSTYIARSRLLQRLNIYVRAYLPRGPIYRLLRTAYRALNTRRPRNGDRDLEVEQLLSRRFAPMLNELEQDFGFDVTNWRRHADRLGSQTEEKMHATAALPPALLQADAAARADVSPVRR